MEMKMANLRASEAMILFGQILADLDQSEFTYGQVVESFFHATEERSGVEYKYSPGELLGFLVGKGLIVYDKDQKFFYVRWEADALNYFDGSAEELEGMDEEFLRESRDPLKNRRHGSDDESPA